MADQIPDSATNAVMWLNADTCIENAEIAYEDSTEDEDGPVDTVISSGDLGVLIDLARYAVATRASPPAMDREAVKWRERWYGSGLLKGLAIVDERGTLIAHLGGDAATHAAVTRIVSAHNATLSADAIRQGEGLRALSDRATPGPWSWEQCGETEDVPVVGIAFSGDDPDCKAPYEGEFRDSDANRMTIAFDWQSCDGHSPSANAAFAVAAVNFVRTLLATPASHASDGGKA